MLRQSLMWQLIAVACVSRVSNCLRQRKRVGKGQFDLAADCESETVCIVTANQPYSHNAGLPGLMQQCLLADPSTKVVALALQDYQGGDFVHYVKHLDGLPKSARFKLRHKVVLSDTAGRGNFCYSFFAGGVWAGAAAGGAAGFKLGLLAHLAGPVAGFTVKAVTTIVGIVVGGAIAHQMSTAVGANCGGVAIAVYSLRKVGVEFDFDADDAPLDTHQSSTTATTKKGTVAARFEINGRQVVIASTHGTEGVRGKNEDDDCSATSFDEKDIDHERKRVMDFKIGLEIVDSLRRSPAFDGAAGVLWGGDFNARTVELDGPVAGCPIWPDQQLNDDANLERLQKGRGILGDGISFISLLAGKNISEAAGLTCPTYKKDKQKLDEKQFRCKEPMSDTFDSPWMYYKSSHPPSWTDRIFHSTDVSWLSCRNAQRVTHAEDHDAVLMTCSVQPGETCKTAGMGLDELAEELNSRCCCKAKDDCRLMRQKELVRSWLPRNWGSGKSFCPGDASLGFHHYRKFGLKEMPEACVDELDGATPSEITFDPSMMTQVEDVA